MILFRNRLIIGWIVKIIKKVFGFIYKILSFLNLHVTLLVLALGLILWITGVFYNVPAIKTAFFIVLALSLVLAGFLSVYKVRKKFKKEDDKSTLGDVSDAGADKGQQVAEQPVQVQPQPTVYPQPPQPSPQPQANFGGYNEGASGYPQQNPSTYPNYNEENCRFDNAIPTPREVYPKYYRVAQNTKYVYAEYADRYELFYDNGINLTKVRTDYKK